MGQARLVLGMWPKCVFMFATFTLKKKQAWSPQGCCPVSEWVNLRALSTAYLWREKSIPFVSRRRNCFIQKYSITWPACQISPLSRRGGGCMFWIYLKNVCIKWMWVFRYTCIHFAVNFQFESSVSPSTEFTATCRAQFSFSCCCKVLKNKSELK